MRKTRHLDTKKSELTDMSMSEYVRQIALRKQVKGFRMADLNLPEEQCKGQMTLEDVI